MSKGVLIGGVIGGIVMFLWGAISHMVLPIGSLGMKSIPDEARVLASLQSSMPEPGLYFFPWMDESAGKTREQQTAEEARWQEKAMNGPSGLLIYLPRGNAGMTKEQLACELLSDLGCSVLAGVLLGWARGSLRSYGKRVLFVALLGLLPWLSISVSNWTWYHFPTSYFLGEGLDQVMGFALAGLVVASTVKDS